MTTTLAYPADLPADVRAAAGVFRSAASAIEQRRHAFSRASGLLDTWQGPSARAAGRWFDQCTTAITSDVDGLGIIATTLDSYAIALDTAPASVDAARAEEAALDRARTALLVSLDAMAEPLSVVPATVVSGARALHSAAAAASTATAEAQTAQAAVAQTAQTVITTLQQHQPDDDSPGLIRGDPQVQGPDWETYGPVGLGPMGPAGCYDVEEPAWLPSDAGAGAYASRFPTLADLGTWLRFRAVADLSKPFAPDAARNMDHYLDGSGTPLEQDVDRMLEDLPLFAEDVAGTREGIIGAAIDTARASGTTAPVTFPISTDWNGHYVTKSQSQNWFYATGGTSYSVHGQITVAPPGTPGGAWTYEMSSAVSVHDRYNWDGGKATDVAGQVVADTELGALHTAGLAREYDLYGSSEILRESGSVR